MIIEKEIITTLKGHNNNVKLSKDIMDGKAFRRQQRANRPKKKRLC